MSNYNHRSSRLIIWYDAHAYEQGHASTRELLESHLGDVFIMNDKTEWQRLIGRDHSSQRLVLIISGQFGREIVPRIHDSPNIVSIYVYCRDRERNREWAKNYSKVKSVHTTLDELISDIIFDPNNN